MKPCLDKDSYCDPTTQADSSSSLGEHSYIGPYCDLVNSHCGRFTFLYGDVRMAESEVAGFASIAKNARIGAEEHPFRERVSSHLFTYLTHSLYGMAPADDEEFLNRRRSNRTVLGYDVWVGHGAVIKAGVHIGNGAVIGANAVVTHDVEPYQIVAGVPARSMGYRFAPDTIAALERIKWWNWTDEQLQERVQDFKHVAAFVKLYDAP